MSSSYLLFDILGPKSEPPRKFKSWEPPRPGTEGSRALRARNPQKLRKESERVSRGPEPQSPQRVRPGVWKKSEGVFLDSFRSPGALIVCRRQGASGQENVHHVKCLHCQKQESFQQGSLNNLFGFGCFRKREGVQKSMGHKVPWKTGIQDNPYPLN